MLKKILVFIPFFIVWVFVALYLVFGLCAVCTSTGPLMFLGVVVYTALILGPMWLYMRWANADPSWLKQVQAEGREAPATIVRVKNTGAVINNTIAVLYLRLRVEPPGEAPFELWQEHDVSFLTGLSYAAGMRVRVRYDPAHRSHLIILGSASRPNRPSRAANANLAEQLDDLAQLHRQGELTDQEYAAAKKKLLG